MFGLGFGEFLVVAIVALVVLGPKELPGVLRQLGRGIAKLKRMSTDLRRQSGIDEIIREEGLQQELETLRSLRGLTKAGMLEAFLEQASDPHKKPRPAIAAASEQAPIALEGEPPDPEQEYPEIGADAYLVQVAIGHHQPSEPAAPEPAAPPEGTLPRSASATSGDLAPAEPDGAEAPEVPT